MSTPSLRCPYCHDELAANAADRVACASCGATHHAECFAEGRGCAATACQWTSVRVGEAEVPLEDLAPIAGDPEALAGLAQAAARPDRRGLRALVGGALTLAAVAGAAALFGPTMAAGVGLFCMVVLLAWVPGRGEHRRPRVRIAGDASQEQSFDPIFGVFRSGSWTAGVLPDHGEYVREQLAKDGVPEHPPAPGELPDVCPHCSADLRDGEEELEAGDEDLWFCYHCGGNLHAQPSVRDDLDSGPKQRKVEA